MSFLERQDINILRTDPYALAITSYALAISNSTKKMTTYEHLKEIAGRSEGSCSFQKVPTESCKISVILFGSMLPNLKGH